MILFPAIDIKDGKVVRLHKGRFDEITTYSDDPLEVAQRWEEIGAKWIHVVDLDGAQTGQMKNFDFIVGLAKVLTIPVQMGGGIREKKDIENLLNAGVQRVILGTKAIQNRDFLKDILDTWKDRVIVSVDCSNGMVTQRGWTENTNVKAEDFALELKNLGLSCLVYTDIARDGTLTGPNFQSIEDLLDKVSIPIIASGGISNIEDIKQLLKLRNKGLIGAITGKAIYEGRLNLKEALNYIDSN